jgi:hypothetical protein
MPSRTQILCLHEGTPNRSIDPIFIRTLLKALDPNWLRPWKGSNVIRTQAYGGRTSLIAAMPKELKRCQAAGGHTTLMVWGDVDHDLDDCEALKEQFWRTAQEVEITREDFESVVFVFAKDRLENWIEFLNTRRTDEAREGPRVRNDREAADAARNLAGHCSSGNSIENMPASLQWSCRNWRDLVKRMR